MVTMVDLVVAIVGTPTTVYESLVIYVIAALTVLLIIVAFIRLFSLVAGLFGYR